MKFKYFILLVISLGFSSASFGSIKISYDLCTKEGDQYRLDINDQHVKVVKNGTTIVNEIYNDLHFAGSKELSDIQHAFIIYLGIKDIQSAVRADVKVSGETLNFLLGQRPQNGAVMIIGRGTEVGFTHWCD